MSPPNRRQRPGAPTLVARMPVPRVPLSPVYLWTGPLTGNLLFITDADGFGGGQEWLDAMTRGE